MNAPTDANAMVRPAGLRADADGLRACVCCGRWLKASTRGGMPYHYNPFNPPVYGAWEPCPGPTPAQRAYAECRYPLGDPERLA